MNILYFITRVLTFTGSCVRAVWEYIVCRIFKLPIEDIRCFKVNEMCSHMEHEFLTKTGQTFLMCFLPMLLNFGFGSLFMLYGSYMIFYAGVKTAMAWTFLYFGISFYCNVFPSIEDALAFKESVYGENGKGLALKILLAPFVAVAVAGAYLERYLVSILTSVIAAWSFPFIFDFTFGVIHKIVINIAT